MLRRWPYIYAGLAFTTLATLLLELSLTRIFSVVFYYHFAFLAISIALFGLGAGGIFSYLVASWRGELPAKLSVLSTAAALATWVSLAVSLTRREPGTAELTAVYFSSALPFFFAGTAVALVISATIERVNRIYFCDLAGAAAGCLLLLPMLELTGGPNTVGTAGLTFAVAGCIWAQLTNSRALRGATGVLAAAILTLLAANAHYGFLDVRHAKGRDLRRQQERFVGWNSFSRVALAGEAGSAMIYIDADASTGVPAFDFDHLSEAERREALKLGPSLPYLLRPGAKVLVIGAGGGWDVARALAAGSRDVTAVEINPLIAETIMRRRFPHYSRGLYWRPEVRLVVEDARAFLRRSREKYQVIQATLVDTWAATAAGAYALSENNLYTLEAFTEYLEHLSDDGVLAFTRWGLNPPRESLRVVSLAAAAIEHLGESQPWRHVAVWREGSEEQLAGWGVLDHILVSRRAFSAQDLAVLRRFAAERGLRPVCLPDEPIPGPFTEMLRSRDRQAFYRSYPFDVSPVTDNRPFFFYTVQPRDLKAFLSRFNPSSADFQINRAVPLLFTLLAVSLTATGLILLLPPLFLGNKLPRERTLVGLLSYFVFIGIGYILVEVSLVQKFILLLGRPSFALSVIIFSMLVASSLGSYFSRRLTGDRQSRLRLLLLAISACIVLQALTVGPLLNAAVAWPLALKVAATVVMIAPGAFLMGMPFPAGLTQLERRHEPSLRWAWSVNAAASVLGSVAALALAIYAGFRETLLAGALMYLSASAALGPLSRQQLNPPWPASLGAATRG